MSNLQPNCCLEFDFRKVDHMIWYDKNSLFKVGYSQQITVATRTNVLLWITHTYKNKMNK